MERGKAGALMEGFGSLDMYYPHLKAKDKSKLLALLLPDRTSASINTWRIDFERSHPKQTLWKIATECWQARGTLVRGKGKAKLEAAKVKAEKVEGKGKGTSAGSGKAKGKGKGKGKGKAAAGSDAEDSNDDFMDFHAGPAGSGEGSSQEATPPRLRGPQGPVGAAGESCSEPASGRHSAGQPASQPAPVGVGILSAPTVACMQKHFGAYAAKAEHDARVQAVEATEGSDGVDCSVCAEAFELMDTVPCASDLCIHFLCKPCFAGYATITVTSGPVSSIPCPMPKCGSLFGTADAKAALSEWDQVRADTRAVQLV